ncbi:MAG: alkaline phosphatase D family protein [Planctomycetota bacterium JB042]
MRRSFGGLLLVAGCASAPMPGVDARAGSGWIDAGPMIGHVSDREARVWVRPREGVELAVVAAQDGLPLAPRVEVLGGGCRRVVLGGLRPSLPVEVTLRDARATDSVGAETVRFSTAPPPSRRGRVRIACGSCIDDGEHGPVPVLGAAAAERPDLFLFLGDNCYYVRGAADPEHYFSTSGDDGEWSSKETMLARQLFTRRGAHLAELARTTPCYATWDDHDYGPNNSDSTFPRKEDALLVFRAVWANPSYGTEAHPGVFTSFRRGPVEVFLLDGRFHRTPEGVPDERAAIWGERQLAWLLEGLERSDAPVKVVANGTQMIFKGKKDDGHWHTARREYYRFLDGLEERGIDGVVLLSGDRHYSELMRIELEDGRSLYELTSSPLQQGREIGPRKEKNRTRVWGLEGNSYGLLTVDVGEDGDGTVTFECRDAANEVPVIDGAPVRTVVELAELRSRGE